MIRTRLRSTRPANGSTFGSLIGLLALVGIVFAVVGVIPESSVVLRTWLASIAALAGLWGYLFHKYHRRMPVRLDVLTVLGLSAANLLPPLYLCMRTGLSPYVDRFDVTDMYPSVSLWTTVGGVALIFGHMMASVGMEERKRFLDDRPTPESFSRPSSDSTRGVLVIAFVTMAVTWATRTFLITQGAYYYVYNNNEFIFGRWWSVTSNLGKLGVLAPLLFWLLAIRSPRWRVVALVTTIAEFAYLVPTGARGEMLQVGLAFVLVVWWRRRQIPVALLAILVAVALITLPIIGAYRNTISQFANINEVSMNASIKAARAAQERFDTEEGGAGGALVDYADAFINRLYDGQAFGYLLKHYYDVFSAENGRTYYERLPWLAVPYFIYPNRVTMEVPLDLWFPLTAASSNPSTFLGEAYVNFGYLGIPVVAFFMGFVLGSFDRLFWKWKDNIVALAIYILIAAVTPTMVNNNLASWLGLLRNSVLFLFLSRAALVLFEARWLAAGPVVRPRTVKWQLGR